MPEDGIKVDFNKMKVIKEETRPLTSSDIRSLLSLVGYYRGL